MKSQVTKRFEKGSEEKGKHSRKTDAAVFGIALFVTVAYGINRFLGFVIVAILVWLFMLSWKYEKDSAHKKTNTALRSSSDRTQDSAKEKDRSQIMTESEEGSLARMLEEESAGLEEKNPFEM